MTASDTQQHEVVAQLPSFSNPPDQMLSAFSPPAFALSFASSGSSFFIALGGSAAGGFVGGRPFDLLPLLPLPLPPFPLLVANPGGYDF